MRLVRDGTMTVLAGRDRRLDDKTGTLTICIALVSPAKARHIDAGRDVLTRFPY